MKTFMRLHERPAGQFIIKFLILSFFVVFSAEGFASKRCSDTFQQPPKKKGWMNTLFGWLAPENPVRVRHTEPTREDSATSKTSATREEPSVDYAERNRLREIERKRQAELDREKELAREARRAEEAKQKMAALMQKLLQDDREAMHLRDGIHYQWLQKQLGGRHVVTLLFGNASELTSDVDPSHVWRLVTVLKETGVSIVYDGDSKLAKIMGRAAGPNGIAITSSAERAKELQNAVVITNPYLRLQAFSNGKVVGSDDSLIGLAQLLEGRLTYVYDPGRHWMDGHQVMAEQAGPFRLGLSHNRENPPAIHTQDDLFKRLTRNVMGKDKPFKVFSLEEDLAAMSADFERITELTQYLLAGEKEMSFDRQKNAAIPGGAVVFGSSSRPADFEPLIFELSHALASQGIPIATGGHGGVMAIANEAAYRAGSYSFGVTIGGGLKLRNESSRNVADYNHTATISSNGYESRIPLLLHNRKVIVIAPGGNGTRKELATALIAMSNSEEFANAYIVFIGVDYYGAFYQWLTNSPYPDRFVSHVRIVDDTESIEDFVRQIQDDDTIDQAQLRTTELPFPGNNPTRHD